MAADSEALETAPTSAEPSSAVDPDSWGLDQAAVVVTALVGSLIDPADLQERAVGFGLLRDPPPGVIGALTARDLSRLLLACYTLPAQVQSTSPSELNRHLSEGRRVFIRTKPETAAAVIIEVVPAIHDHQQTDLMVPQAAQFAPGRMLVPEFLAAHAGRLHHSIVAALRWDDLPSSGGRFFGGDRSALGELYWYGAECETDGTGRILRF